MRVKTIMERLVRELILMKKGQFKMWFWTTVMQNYVKIAMMGL